MKGYEFVCRLVVFVMLLFSWTVLPPVTARDTMACTTAPKSFWLRNQCNGGFVTVVKPPGSKRFKVVATHKGLTRKSPKVRLLKESCHDDHGGFFGSVITRLYSPDTDRYICFNKKGKVIAKRRRHLPKMGPYCMFTEEISSKPNGRKSLHIRSFARKDWYLGFRRKYRASLPFTPACRRRRRRKRKKGSCDYSFTGEYPVAEPPFLGLLGMAGGTSNELPLGPGSPAPSYYYIESNDERYLPGSPPEETEERREAALRVSEFESQL